MPSLKMLLNYKSIFASIALWASLLATAFASDDIIWQLQTPEALASAIRIDAHRWASVCHALVPGPIHVRQKTNSEQSWIQIPVQLVAQDPQSDLCLLAGASEGTIRASSTLQWNTSAALNVPILVQAYDPHKGQVKIPGRLLAWHCNTDKSRCLIEHNAPTEHGYSGGALLDAQQQLIGILTLRRTDVPSLGYAIPAFNLLQLLSQTK